MLGGFTPLQSETLSDVAARLNARPMSIALATVFVASFVIRHSTFEIRHSRHILLIPGTSSVEHLRENVAAARDRAGKLAADLNRVNGMSEIEGKATRVGASELGSERVSKRSASEWSWRDQRHRTRRDRESRGLDGNAARVAGASTGQCE
jgi:hypothetical protein